MSKQDYAKHIPGTPQYEAYKNARARRGQPPQSILTISEEEAQRIIVEKAGTGIVRVTGSGVPMSQESIVCDKVIGAYYADGAYHSTYKARMAKGT